MTQTSERLSSRLPALALVFYPPKSRPKEMLPVVDRPLIQWAVEEAAAAGCNEFIFVSSPYKRAILDIFPAPAYEEVLKARQVRRDGTTRLACPRTPNNGRFQHKPLASDTRFGAREAVGDELAVILPDDMVLHGTGRLSQMVEQYEQLGGNLVPLKRFPTTRRNAMACWTPVLKPVHWWPLRVC